MFSFCSLEQRSVLLFSCRGIELVVRAPFAFELVVRAPFALEFVGFLLLIFCCWFFAVGSLWLILVIKGIELVGRVVD